MTGSAGARYDRIGRGYARRRREDPALADRIRGALGDVTSIVNVGAGTGSYEPAGIDVIAVEPSELMIAQRPAAAAPARRGRAEALPLATDSVDGALTVLSLHHWNDPRAGVDEMRRVATGPVVIVTIDPLVSGEMWLMADYLHEVAELDRRIFPDPVEVATWLKDGRVETVPVPQDCEDWFLLSFWAHPERVLDPAARAATSGFSRVGEEVNRRVVDAVARDLASGAWDLRHGHLRSLAAYDAGLRIVTGRAG